MQFPSFVSLRECLACQGCCRFQSAESPWRPRVSAQEIRAMCARVSEETQYPISPADFDAGHVRAREHNGQAQCVFLNPTDNKCRIYENRPMECQFYPFLFLKKEGRVWVGVHLSCPAVQEKCHTPFFTNYLSGLKIYFQSQEAVDSLKTCIASGGDYAAYADEIDELFPLEF